MVFERQKVGKLPLEIDLVTISPKRGWRPDFAQFPKLFEYFRRYNVMEIKTEKDRLKIEEKAPIVETILDLYESEVKTIMLNIREKSLRNILSVVETEKIISALGEEKIISALGEKKIVSALGEKKVIAALGEKKVIAALGDEKLVAALLRNKKLLRLLLAKLDRQQLPKMLEKKNRH